MSSRYVWHMFRGCNHERYYISWNLARMQVFIPASRRLPRAQKTSKRFQHYNLYFFLRPLYTRSNIQIESSLVVRNILVDLFIVEINTTKKQI